ncbi:MAG: YeeE/YedE family protein [Enterobacterales bacterium]|nr:YeeE/YedE family protein [Enterobacterales bacterium]
MTTFPLPLAELLGQWGSYSIYFLIGIGFGFILESAGFGNSKKLAAQFYLKELTVFKVMFTAIITAMVLVFMSSAIGLLDFNLVWVPPTYLWPGIVGGFIMGIGFIIGGFCPGTSLVAVTTKKIDGFFFVGGVLIGIFLFGETVSMFDVFFDSSFYGRFTLPELFGLSYGTVVLLVVAMAFVMFLGAEAIEKNMQADYQPLPKWSSAAAAGIMIVAVGGLLIGQPDNADRWQRRSVALQPKLDNREVQITPQEMLNLVNDTKLKAILLDVRDEVDYNQFHIHGAQLSPMAELVTVSRDLVMEPANAVVVVMSNDEQRATEAWRVLKAESLPNVYILDGGVNNWLRFFSDEEFKLANAKDKVDDDCLAFEFDSALGDRIAMAEPHLDKKDPRFLFEPKIKLQLKRAPSSGGCG